MRYLLLVGKKFIPDIYVFHNFLKSCWWCLTQLFKVHNLHYKVWYEYFSCRLSNWDIGWLFSCV